MMKLYCRTIYLVPALLLSRAVCCLAEHRLVEEEGASYHRTGISRHRLEYNDHPYDVNNGRRLQQDDTNFQPLRIHVDTSALSATRDGSSALLDDAVSEIVVAASMEFWSKTLSVILVSGNVVLNAAQLTSQEYCGPAGLAKVPEEHLTTGISDADFILYVSGSTTNDEDLYCQNPSIRGFGVSCNYDQFDRPIAGLLHFCRNQIELFSNGDIDYSNSNITATATANLARALGMANFPFFWDPDTGQPRTQRDRKSVV